MSVISAVRATVLASLLLSTSAMPAAADAAGEQMLRDFFGAIDASADWTATATIRSAGADTIAQDVVISRKTPDMTVKIRTLVTTNLAQGTDGGFTASAIGIEDVSIVAPTLEYSIPLATVADVYMPSTEGFEFDPSRMMSSFGRLYSILAETEFSEFEIAEMRSKQPIVTADPKTSGTLDAVYRDLYVAGMSEGTMSESSIGLMTFSATGEAPFSFQVASATGSEVDIAAMAHVMDPDAYVNGRGDGVWYPIMTGVEYSGISGTGPDGATFGIDRITASNLDARQPEKPFFEVFDRLADPSLSPEEKANMDPRDILAIYAGWRMGEMAVEGVSVEVPAEKTSFELASMKMGGFSNEGIDSFTMSAMRGEGPNGSGSLDSFEMRGLKFPDVGVMIDAGETGSGPKTPEQIVEMLAAMPRLGHFGLRGVSGAQGAEAPFTLGSFTLDFGGWEDTLPASTKIALTDLYIPRNLLALNPAAAAQVEALGFDGLAMSAAFGHEWSAEQGSYAFNSTVSVKDGGDIDISYALSGITTDWLVQALAASSAGEDGGVAMMGLIAQLALTNAKVTVTDRSLLDRDLQATIDMQALGIDVPTYKQQLKDALPLILSSMAPPQIVEIVVPPLQSFLAGNQTLVAEAAPVAPVLVPEIMTGALDPIGLVNKLGLTVQSAPAQ